MVTWMPRAACPGAEAAGKRLLGRGRGRASWAQMYSTDNLVFSVQCFNRILENWSDGPCRGPHLQRSDLAEVPRRQVGYTSLSCVATCLRRAPLSLGSRGSPRPRARPRAGGRGSSGGRVASGGGPRRCGSVPFRTLKHS